MSYTSSSLVVVILSPATVRWGGITLHRAIVNKAAKQRLYYFTKIKTKRERLYSSTCYFVWFLSLVRRDWVQVDVKLLSSRLMSLFSLRPICPDTTDPQLLFQHWISLRAGLYITLSGNIVIFFLSIICKQLSLFRNFIRLPEGCNVAKPRIKLGILEQ